MYLELEETFTLFVQGDCPIAVGVDGVLGCAASLVI
jgi:hypothetical protein